MSADNLSLIPTKKPGVQWHTDFRKHIVLKMEHKGAFPWIARKLFGRPRYTWVHLDRMGSFIWPLIDGENTVAHIAAKVKAAFGDEAEPLYPRLIKYLRILENRHLITF